MPTRHFTIAELAALNVPPDDPAYIEYDEHVLADEQVAVLKYTAQRRCVFRAPDDERTYAVEYEAELDTGDYEVGGGARQPRLAQRQRRGRRGRGAGGHHHEVATGRRGELTALRN
jgi:hypothetical protein